MCVRACVLNNQLVKKTNPDHLQFFFKLHSCFPPTPTPPHPAKSHPSSSSFWIVVMQSSGNNWISCREQKFFRLCKLQSSMQTFSQVKWLHLGLRLLAPLTSKEKHTWPTTVFGGGEKRCKKKPHLTTLQHTIERGSPNPGSSMALRQLLSGLQQ